MADDILRYSDLIAPDNSIEDLIRLLEKVQSEYSAITQVARQYAANMQTDMRRINTTTKAGRDELARLTTQTDTLNDVLRGLGTGYDLIDKKLAEVRSGASTASQGIAALAEQVRRYSEIARGMRNMREIFEVQTAWGLADDNLLRGLKELENVIDHIGPELNKYVKSITEAILESIKLQETLDFDAAGRAAKEALVPLRAAFESLTEQYSLFEAKERNSEVGKATKDNMDILRSAITRIQAIMEPLVDKTTELVRAEQGLEVAMSKEGQEAERTKQKIAELNKETRLRGTIANEVSDAEKALKAQLELTYAEWEKLSEAEQKSAQGQDLIARITSLATILVERNAGIDTAVRVTKNLVKAEQDLGVAMSEEGQAIIRTKQAISELNKETRLQNIEAEAEEGAYDKLRAQLARAIAEWKKMGATKRDTTAAGQALTAHIVDLSTQLKGLDNRLRAATESMSQDQIEMAMAADVAEKLAQAKAKVKIATSAEYRELMELSEEQREANRIAKLNAILKREDANSYNGMAAQYELNKIKLKKLALANRELTEDEKELVAETFILRNEMKKIQELTGVHVLSVGEYGKVWDSFGFSIQQIVREMPAAAQGINNLFIAVSNNIPIFVDELMRLRKENAAFIAKNQPDKVVNIGKRIAESLLSWQTALMALLTALTMFGDEITKWIGDLFRANDALLSLKSAMKSISKEIKNTNDNYGTSTANFKELQQQYKELSSEAEKAEWLEKNKGATEELWLAIDDVNDADRIFIEQADKVIEAYKLRAQAAAAEKLAIEELEGALNKQAKIERKIGKYRDKIEKEKQKKAKAEGLGLPTETFDAEIRAFEREIAALEAKAKRKVGQRIADAETFINLENEFRQEYGKVLKEPDNKESDEGRDLTDRIYKTHLDTTKKYRESETALIKFEYDRQAKAAEDKAATEIAALEETYRKTEDWIKDEGDDYKKLTEEEKRLITESQENIRLTIENIRKKLNEDLEQIELDGRIAIFKVQEEGIQNQLALVKEGSYQELQLRKDLLDLELERALTENAKLEVWQRQKEEDIIRKYEKQQTDLEQEYAIKRLKFSEEVIALQLEAAIKGGESEYELQKKLLEKQRDLEIAENKLLAPGLRQQEADIIAKYNKMLEDLANERNIALKEAAINGIELQLQAVKAGSDKEYKLQLELLNKQEALEKEKNTMLDESLRVEEGLITNSYERRRKLLQGQYELANFMQKQATAKAQYMAGAKSAGTGLFVTERPSGKAKKLGLVRDTGIGSKFASEYQLEAFEIEQQIAALKYQIEQAGKGLNNWNTDKINEANAQIEVLKEELKGVTDIMSLIAKEGIGGGILASLGFDKDSISALQDAGSIIIDQIQAIMQAEVEAAEKAAEAAQERVDAAKSAYEAEIEARNNGYANSVATAKKEMELEKKKQAEKQKELEKAQKWQSRLDSVSQASSLLTATANILASYTKLGLPGQVLSIAAIASMWGIWTAAKLRAKTVASQEYGEGGLEFLEGGSHASGNDIDLGTVNSRGRRMRAEGGEAMAIINKKNTRKYKALLPGIVDSLNAGNFEDKYLSSLNTSGISLSMNSASIDISKIEDDVADIRKQNETKYYTADGYLIIQRKNVKRIIKN